MFLTIVGKLDKAEEAFNNPKIFPNDRLPTNRDRKASWVIQRDSESDLSPVTDKPFKEHHGGDYIFAYWLYKKRREGWVLRKIKNSFMSYKHRQKRRS